MRICVPAIVEQPAGAAIVRGQQHAMRIDATGGSLTYQWYVGGRGDTANPVPGATAAALTTPATLEVTTSYWVRVTSAACGTSSADSESVTVTVCQPPQIEQQPRSDSYPKNAAFTLTVEASGDGLQYQWYRGERGDTSQPIGDNSCSITLTAAATQKYWVRVTGSCGAADSQTVEASVYPLITQQPVSTSVCGLNATATFTVGATGAAGYRWYRQVSTGAVEQVGTEATLPIVIDATPVKFWAQAWSGGAVTTSSSVSATVTPTPTLNSFTAPSYAANQYTLTAGVPSDQRASVGYRFYRGPLGTTSVLIVDSTANYVTVTPPSKPMTYWVRVYFRNHPSRCFADAALTIE